MYHGITETGRRCTLLALAFGNNAQMDQSVLFKSSRKALTKPWAIKSHCLHLRDAPATGPTRDFQFRGAGALSIVRPTGAFHSPFPCAFLIDTLGLLTRRHVLGLAQGYRDFLEGKLPLRACARVLKDIGSLAPQSYRDDIDAPTQVPASS